MGDAAAGVAGEVTTLGTAAAGVAEGAAVAGAAALTEGLAAAGLAAAGAAEADLPVFEVEATEVLPPPTVWFDPEPALPGRKASLRSSAIEKPVCSSGASDKSGRLVMAI